MFFITPAWAQETANKVAETATSTATEAMPAEPSTWVTIAPVLIVFVIFYVLFIMPQNKRIREHQTAIKALQKGDKVVTGGGIVAKVSKIINDDEIELELSSGVNVVVLRHTIVGAYQPIPPKK